MSKNKNAKDYTPDNVELSEELIRTIFHPDHIDTSGNLKPSAISSDPLKHGASVDRKQYANSSYMQRNINKLISKVDGRSLSRFGLIKHSSVLEIKDFSSNTALKVNSDPIKENEAHALIFLNHTYKPAETKKIRKDLIDELNLVGTLEEALR